MEINETDTEVVKSEELLTEESTPAEPTVREIQLAENLRRAEARIEKMKLDTKVEKKVEVELQKKVGELDNADYALLAVKGIDEDDSRIDFIKEKMVKWNMPLRELLKDEDIKAKLKSLKIEGDVTRATPSSSRRASGETSDNDDYWFAKYERDGSLDGIPAGMKEKIVNRKYEASNPRKNPFE